MSAFAAVDAAQCLERSGSGGDGEYARAPLIVPERNVVPPASQDALAANAAELPRLSTALANLGLEVYRVDVSRVGGLRLVDRTLEILDGDFWQALNRSCRFETASTALTPRGLQARLAMES